MSSMKVAVSARLEAESAAFLDDGRESRGLGSRSEALELAIRTLRGAASEADDAAAMDERSAADAALEVPAVADRIDTDAPR
jgi:hypothetical protein